VPEAPHDATVALRLELGRERDRANAFEAALRKEVLAVIGDAAVRPKMYLVDGADTETWKLRSDNWQKFCQLHIDENKKLKAEVERLTKAGDEMAESLSKELGNADPDVRRWLAAKEGKQS
jgi:hypothetical protein